MLMEAAAELLLDGLQGMRAKALYYLLFTLAIIQIRFQIYIVVI